MKDIPIGDVRNFVLMGHTGSGKTTLVDTLLARLGGAPQAGSVDNGTSLADTTAEEKARKLTIYAKPFDGVYRAASGARMNLVFIDTPGYVDFGGQAAAAARVADLGVIVVDAHAGIQVGTQQAWRRCEDAGLPRAVLLTGLDRENADFEAALAAARATWGRGCLPVTLPAPDLSAAIPVMAAADAPPAMREAVEAARQAVIELAVEGDDALLEKYLGGEELAPVELDTALRKAVNERRLIPVFAVCARKDVGVTELLEGISRYFPSPLDRGAVDAGAPFAGLVWKSINDPFAGQLSFVRVVSGTVRQDDELFNSSREHKEKVGALLVFSGGKPAGVPEASAGEIVALPKLKGTSINDTLCAAGQKVLLPPVRFPQPLTAYAVSPKTRGDEDRLATGLARVAEDDPTLRVERNAETHEMILAGMGEIHLEQAVERLKQRTNVDIDLKTPKVAYRETVTAVGEGHYKHKKQTGGRGQYAEVFLRVMPRPEGETEWFENAIVGGAIPSNFVPAVQKGLVDGMVRGAVAGYPVERVKVSIYDGSYHEVDSSEVAFKIAAARAFREAMSKAGAVLLEPIMTVKVTIPEHFMGDVNGDLIHKRGQLLGLTSEGGMQTITAEAPQAELFRYTSELRSITGGRGTFEMAFTRYEPVPGNVAQKVIAAAEKVKDEDE